jgi:hypothetical protein
MAFARLKGPSDDDDGRRLQAVYCPTTVSSVGSADQGLHGRMSDETNACMWWVTHVVEYSSLLHACRLYRSHLDKLQRVLKFARQLTSGTFATALTL